MYLKQFVYNAGNSSRVVKGASGLDLRKKLNDQRSDTKFCDTLLRVNDDSIGAHRCVLAAASQYFHTTFYGMFRDKQEPEVDLTVSFKSTVILKSIIDFIYGEELTVTEENVSELLGGADFLMLPDIKALCLEFLLENLTLQNCLWTWTMASLYSFPALAEICQNLAISRFHDCLIDLEDTLVCPPVHMKSFLNKGLTMHCTTIEIKKFTQKYVDYDSESRNECKIELENCALSMQERFHKGESQEEQNDNFKKAGSVPKKLLKARSCNSKPAFPADKQNVSKKRSTTECFVFLKSKNRMNESQLETEFKFSLYSPTNNKWYQLCEFARPLHHDDSFDNFCVGFGADKNLFLIKGRYSEKLTLINIFTGDQQLIRALPSGSYGRGRGLQQASLVQTKPFSSGPRLYCLSVRKLYQDASNIEEQNERLLVNVVEEASVNTLYLHQYNVVKNKWHQVCILEKFDGVLFPLQILYHDDEIFYIFLITKSSVSLFRFNGYTKEVRSLQSLTPEENQYEMGIGYELADAFVYGSPSTLTIASSRGTREFSASYDIKRDTWEIHEQQSEDHEENTDQVSRRYDFKDEPVVYSHTLNEGYLLSKGVVESLISFTAINMSDKTERKLLTFPELQPFQSFEARFSVCRVPCQLLEQLKAPQGKDDLTEPICTASETRRFVKEYKRKYLGLPEEEIKDLSDEDFDDIDPVYDSEESYGYPFGYGPYGPYEPGLGYFFDHDDDDSDDFIIW